jgi:hypothetical protein
MFNLIIGCVLLVQVFIYDNNPNWLVALTGIFAFLNLAAVAIALHK